MVSGLLSVPDLNFFKFLVDVGEVIQMFFSYILGLSDRFADLIETVRGVGLLLMPVFIPFRDSMSLLITLIAVVIVLRIFGRY